MLDTVKTKIWPGLRDDGAPPPRRDRRADISLLMILLFF